MKRIIMFSTQTCPHGDAGATRLHYMGKLFKLINYSPVIVGIKSAAHDCNSNDQLVDGIMYHFFEPHNRYYYSQVKKYLRDCGPIDAMLIYSIPIKALLFLKKYAKKNHIILIHDSVEWYSKSEFKHPYLSYEYWRKELYNRYLIDRNFKVIGISSYLCNHFKGRGIDTVRIPVILKIKDSIAKKNLNSKYINIAYIGGYAPKKDQIGAFLRAYIGLDSQYKKKIHLSFIGMNVKQVAAIAEVDTLSIEKTNSIQCYGKIQRNELIEMMRTVDYTVLIRHSEKRYARAGFPTKVVESLASATPVIANISSDLGLYLQDGINSFVLKDLDEEYLKNFLVSLADQMQIGNRMNMMKKARNTAEEFFDYSVYCQDLINLIGDEQ